MKRIFCIFLLILIINSILSSDCTNKIANSQSDTSTENLNPTQIVNTDSTKPASEPTTKPVAEPTATEAPNNEETPNNQETPNNEETPNNGNRRILDVLNENDCKNLRTQDDNKYQCVVSSDHSRCVEVEKEGSKLLYLSFPLVLIFIIL